MKKKSYYLDSCIWLNIINKEGGLSSSSKKFIEELIIRGDEIYHSEIILFEIKFQELPFVDSKFIRVNINDYRLAVILKERYFLTIGDRDILHLAICINRRLILVTRDKKFLKIANLFIKTRQPF